MKAPAPAPTPRTDRLVQLFASDERVAFGCDQKTANEADYLLKHAAPTAVVEQLLILARKLETALATWRQLPPREHYNVADCHKAIRWHVGKLREHHDHITAVVARMEALNKALPDVGGA